MIVRAASGYAALAAAGLAVIVGVVVGDGDEPDWRMRAESAARLRAPQETLRAQLVADMLRPAAPTPVDVPAADGAGRPELRVHVDPREMSIDGEPVSTAALEERFALWARIHPDAIVIVEATADTPHAEVVRIMELARARGVERLAIAAAP